MSRLKIPSLARRRKRVGAFSGIDVKHDESVLDFSAATECYNFDMSSGALTDGYGIAAKDIINQQCTGFWTFKYALSEDDGGGYSEQYIFQMQNGMLKFYDTAINRLYYISGFPYPRLTAIPYRLDSKDVLLLSCEGHRLLTWDGGYIREYSGTPIISSMALHYERLFVISPESPTTLLFSDDLDPRNWSASPEEGGFIDMPDERGFLIKVISFANYLYVFRERGISRVTAFGDQSEFSVTNLFVSAGRIYPESIVKCGSIIVFLASDGLYAFDGYDCTRVLRNLDGYLGAPSAAAYFNGKYYLSCRMEFKDGNVVGCEEEDEYKSNALLVFDPFSGEYSISRGMDINFLNACSFMDEDFLVGCDSVGTGVIKKCGKRFDDPLYKHWRSPVTDFGLADKTKLLREMYVTTATECGICVLGEKRTKYANVSAGSRRIRLNAREKRFALEIDCCEADVNIKPPTLVYTTF